MFYPERNMFAKIIQHLHNMAHSRWYWLSLIIIGTSLLTAALIFQHVLEEMPCLVCIHVRLWISLLVLIALFGLLTCRSRCPNIIANLAVVGTAVALTERSYLLLGTERGFIFSDCGFNLGLPGWFAIDDWLPWLYRIETSCGYTPELIFGITMAEALIVLSVALLLISLSVTASSLFKR